MFHRFVIPIIWRPHVCAHTYLSPHDCAQTRLCPHTFVPTHVCAHTHLCPQVCAQTRLCTHTFVRTHTFVHTHVCAHTRLCTDRFVPKHICALTCYNRASVVTIVSGQKRVRTFVPRHIFGALACYNKITKYSSRYTAGDW